MRRRQIIAHAVSVLAGSIVILAMLLVPVPDRGQLCRGAPLTVWSSIEPGKYDAVNAVAATIGPCFVIAGVSSGSAERALEKTWSGGRRTPDVWLPSDSLWVNLLNSNLESRDHARPGRSIASSRMVIAVVRRRAEALGWTKTPPTWSDIRAAATTGPAERRLRLIKENARDSTSGAMSTLLAYRAGSAGQLPNSRVIRDRPPPALAYDIEHAVVWYPPEIVEFLRTLSATPRPLPLMRGAEAIIVQEALFAQFPELARTLVSLPIRGEDARTDHPFVRRAHLSASAEALARTFEERLTGAAELRKHRFDAPIPPRPEWFRESAVVEAVLDKWSDKLRRRVRLTILLDESVPLAPADRAAVETGLVAALRRLRDTDHVALVGFPDPSGGVVDPLPRQAGDSDEPVYQEPSQLVSALPGALRDATATAVRRTPLLLAMQQAELRLATAGVNDQNPEVRAVLTLTARGDTDQEAGGRRELLTGLSSMAGPVRVQHYVVPIGHRANPTLAELDRFVPVVQPGPDKSLTAVLDGIATELGAD